MVLVLPPASSDESQTALTLIVQYCCEYPLWESLPHVLVRRITSTRAAVLWTFPAYNSLKIWGAYSISSKVPETGPEHSPLSHNALLKLSFLRGLTLSQYCLGENLKASQCIDHTCFHSLSSRVCLWIPWSHSCFCTVTQGWEAL